MSTMDKDKPGQMDRPSPDRDKDRQGHPAPRQDPGRKPQQGGGGQGDRGTQEELR